MKEENKEFHEKRKKRYFFYVIYFSAGLILGIIISRCPDKTTQIREKEAETMSKISRIIAKNKPPQAQKETKTIPEEETEIEKIYVYTEKATKTEQVIKETEEKLCSEIITYIDLIEKPEKLWNKREAKFRFISPVTLSCYINNESFPCQLSFESSISIGEDGEKKFSVYYGEGICRRKILEYDFFVDTTPPITEIQPVGFSELLTKSEAQIKLIVNEPYKSTLCKIDDGFWMDCSSGKLSLTKIEDGWHSISAFSIDIAGNKENPPKEFFFKVDAKPPMTLLISAPPSATNVPYAELEFISDEEEVEFECDINNSGWKKCSSPLKITNPQIGLNTVRIRSKDSFGRYEVVPVIYSWGYMPGEFLQGPPKPFIPPKKYIEMLKKKKEMEKNIERKRLKEP